MTDAAVTFLTPAPALMRRGSAWHAVDVMRVDFAPTEGVLTVTIANPIEGGDVWACAPNSLKTSDARLDALLRQALKRAMAAKVSGILGSIGRMTEALVRGEDPEDVR